MIFILNARQKPQRIKSYAITTGALASLLLITPVACKESSKDPRAVFYYNKACHAAWRDKFAEARTSVDKSLSFDPTNASAIFLSGRIYEAFDESEQAYAQFEKAKAIDMSAAVPYDYYWAATSCSRNNRAKEAMALLNAGLAKYPHFKNDSGLMYAKRGVLKKNQGDLEGALKDFSSAISEGTGAQSPWLQRAIIYQDKKLYEKAISDYSHLIDNDVRSQESGKYLNFALKGRAQCYGAIGRKDLQTADTARYKSSTDGWANDLLR